MLARRRTNSGADIIELDGHVIKLGDEPAVRKRVNEQAMWLEEHASSGLVKVLSRWDGGYIMPRYDDTWWRRGRVVNMRHNTHVLLQILRDNVWCRPAEWSQLISNPLWRRWVNVRDRLPRDERDRADDLVLTVRWEDVPLALTHGDPTLSNVMVGYDGHCVLADPIPATSEIPDIRAVDLGKVLQSALGWEGIAFSGEVGEVTECETAVEIVFEECEDDNECKAALFCCVLHVARLIPYYPAHAGRAVREIAHAALRL